MANQIRVGGDVIGRDGLIRLIWKHLKTESIRFTAERRIGKTTVMQKMQAEPIKDMEVIYLDVEGVESPQQYVEKLAGELKPLMSKTQNTKRNFTQLIESFNGFEIMGAIKFPESNKIDWQGRLEKILECVCHGNDKFTMVLMLDELPYMLQKISQNSEQGATQALQLLDSLRELRNKHKSNLRMVYAGSIGLHHVLINLQGNTLPSEPVNDMPLVEIKELEPTDALVLAKQLIAREKLETDNLENVAQAVAIKTGCVPFYMIRIVARLSEQEGSTSSEDVSQCVLKHLSDDGDAWEMEHFRSRLKIYYPATVQDAQGRNITHHEIVSTILDTVAVATEALSIDQVWQAIKAQQSLSQKALIVELLRWLALDHYLVSDTNKRYSFRFALIQQWWLTAQGLKNHD